MVDEDRFPPVVQQARKSSDEPISQGKFDKTAIAIATQSYKVNASRQWLFQDAFNSKLIHKTYSTDYAYGIVLSSFQKEQEKRNDSPR